ncbi:MAG: hypothetical protein JO318_08420, partial [Chloroflexi bacterium]|nr:hypothetical protein [Chloroflexota bacterium]
MVAPRLVLVTPQRRKARRLRRIVNAVALALTLGEIARRAIQGPGGRYSYTPSLAAQLFAYVSVWIDQHIGWPNLPLPFGLTILLGERIMLRWQNLHDTNVLPTTPLPDLKTDNTNYLTERTIDGTFNDLRDPRMGSAGTRFGRNVPNEFTFPDPEPQIYSPNPRVVSLELLTRNNFVPATSLNMLAAAWIQFMTRDWFTHGTGDKNNMWQIPLPPGDDFPQNPMLIPKTIADPTRPPNTESAGPATHVNLQTPWWDASQLYPTDASLQASTRTGSGGK